MTTHQQNLDAVRVAIKSFEKDLNRALKGNWSDAADTTVSLATVLIFLGTRGVKYDLLDWIERWGGDPGKDLSDAPEETVAYLANLLK